MKIIPYFTLLVLSLIFLSACDQRNDFDMVCGYFDMLEKEEKLADLTSLQKYNYINELISKNLSTESEARESWNAIVGYVPAEGRYSMYKEAAEASLEKPWQCESIQSILKDI